MIDARDIGGIVGAPALDPEGQKVGTVKEVLVDPETGLPTWAAINPGLFSGSDAFVPLDTADWDRENLRLPFSKKQVKDSPRFKIDAALAPAEQELLRRHYAGEDAHDGDSRESDGSDRDRASRDSDDTRDSHVVREHAEVEESHGVRDSRASDDSHLTRAYDDSRDSQLGHDSDGSDAPGRHAGPLTD